MCSLFYVIITMFSADEIKKLILIEIVLITRWICKKIEEFSNSLQLLDKNYDSLLKQTKGSKAKISNILPLETSQNVDPTTWTIFKTACRCLILNACFLKYCVQNKKTVKLGNWQMWKLYNLKKNSLEIHWILELAECALNNVEKATLTLILEQRIFAWSKQV